MNSSMLPTRRYPLQSFRPEPFEHQKYPHKMNLPLSKPSQNRPLSMVPQTYHLDYPMDQPLQLSSSTCQLLQYLPGHAPTHSVRLTPPQKHSHLLSNHQLTQHLQIWILLQQWPHLLFSMSNPYSNIEPQVSHLYWSTPHDNQTQHTSPSNCHEDRNM